MVALEAEVNISEAAQRVSPAEFNQMMKNPDVVLFDVRNKYESAIGRFPNAITPDISLFKELPKALEKYEDLKNKTVVTYCTGGIHCEKASALMRKQGFKEVYQLDGGIINYARAYPKGAFEGDCFVFDDRMKVSFRADSKKLGTCIGCKGATNDYYNCAYKPCNKLVLVCPDCRPGRQTCTPMCDSRIILTAV